jgi:hypothetical protein
MAGQAKLLVERIIRERSRGNPMIAVIMEKKMILKGVNPKKWHALSEDDPAEIALLRRIAGEFGVQCEPLREGRGDGE